jgi:putative peptide zinc metalloprotease protein
VVDDRRQVFLGVLKQESSLALSVASSAQAANAQVRIEGERAAVHGVTQVVLVPHSQSALPSAALSPLAGGTVPVLRNAESNVAQAVEAFFLLRAELVTEAGRQDGDPLRHGRTSWLRIELPAKPLLLQAWTWASQYLQRRYQV